MSETSKCFAALLCFLFMSSYCWRVEAQREARGLQQFGGDDAISLDARIAADRLSQPFRKILDTESASGKDAQRLYEQASSVSLISYLLFGAAEPLSKAVGSSGALLPYLSPRTLYVYATQPGICSSTLVEQLYGLSQSLYGTPALQACHYDLLNSFRAVFAWVADNIPLTFQGVPGQPPEFTAAWPDVSTISDADFAAAVSNALLTQAELSETAAVLASGRCGLDIPTFASLVPSISSALLQLHADLAELQLIGDAPNNPPTADPPTLGSYRRGLSAEATSTRGSDHDSKSGGGGVSRLADAPSLLDTDDQGLLAVINKRRSMQAQTAADYPEYVFDMPPASFNVQPSSAMPKALIGLVFHVISYRDTNGGIAPLGYPQSPAYAERILQIVNYIAKPTNFSFFVRDVRYNTTEYPYLLAKNRRTWLEMGSNNCRPRAVPCLWMYDGIVTMTAYDFPRSINIYVIADSSWDKTGTMGYTWLPISDVDPSGAYIYLTWDTFTMMNTPLAYDYGGFALAHELFHFLGLGHTFTSIPGAAPCLFEGDYVADTPSIKDNVRGLKFAGQAVWYCVDLFWGRFGGDMRSAYQRWSTTLGIPDLDKNAWADSCPKAPGYDELANHMTYSFPACNAALGHFTVEQAQRAHYLASEYQPLMYAWGQYYASQAAPPPPQLSPPPLNLNRSCMVTAVSSCPCKSSWQYNGSNYYYCDDMYNDGNLLCEVENTRTCASCKNHSPQCIRHCAGTAELCNRPQAPLAGNKASPAPPPPLPPSPPPRPPPPPPDTIPSACKVSTSGCACRSSWSALPQYRYVGQYCTLITVSPNATYFGCVVTPDCPTYRTEPLQDCNPTLLALNATYCDGSVRRWSQQQPRKKPSAPKPAAPPNRRQPRPPRSK